MSSIPQSGYESNPANELRHYDGLGLQLIPLNPHDSKDAGGRPKGKVPRDVGWRTADYSSFDAAEHLRGGGNVGVRLTADVLVVDVDPRNGGRESLTRLFDDLGIDATAYPTVETGGGGQHLYMSKPADVALRDSLPQYPGVELKSDGRQVVAAGSIHPETGRRYEWDPLAGGEGPGLPTAPEALIELSRRPQSPPNSGGGEYTPGEVASMLSRLDAREFRDHDEWLPLMMSCHHASGGSAKAEFVAWSTSDPKYAGRGAEIGRRWDSLHADAPRGITHRTLLKALADRGLGEHVPAPSARVDFAEEERQETVAFSQGDHMGLARAMLSGRHLVRWNGDWLEYDAGAYRPVSDEQMRAMAWSWLENQQISTSDGTGKPLRPSKLLVDNVLEAAASQRLVHTPPPCWLGTAPDGQDDPEPREVISLRNGILHVSERRLMPQTPRFFTLQALPFDYDPRAPEPSRWMQLVHEMWPDDADRDQRDALQEFMGYLLTPDTSLQKMLALVGPPRSGKGTVNWAIRQLLGEASCCAPSADDLAGPFRFQGLIGKSLATHAAGEVHQHVAPRGEPAADRGRGQRHGPEEVQGRVGRPAPHPVPTHLQRCAPAQGRLGSDPLEVHRALCPPGLLRGRRTRV